MSATCRRSMSIAVGVLGRRDFRSAARDGASETGRHGFAWPPDQRERSSVQRKKCSAVLKQAVAFIDKGEYTSPIAARQKVVKAPATARRATAGVREGAEGQQEGCGGVCGLQSELQKGIRGVDRGRQAARDARQANRNCDRMDQRRQAAKLEVSELLRSRAFTLLIAGCLRIEADGIRRQSFLDLARWAARPRSILRSGARGCSESSSSLRRMTRDRRMADRG